MEEITSGNLIVRTLDIDGKAIKDIVVHFINEGMSACNRTDNNGVAVFTKLPLGDYYVVGRSLDGSMMGIEECTIAPRPNNSVDIKMKDKTTTWPENGTIRFIVIDTINYNQPVQGVAVTITSVSPTEIRNTNSLGIVDFGVFVGPGSSSYTFTIGSTSYTETLQLPDLFKTIVHSIS